MQNHLDIIKHCILLPLYIYIPSNDKHTDDKKYQRYHWNKIM